MQSIHYFAIVVIDFARAVVVVPVGKLWILLNVL